MRDEQKKKERDGRVKRNEGCVKDEGVFVSEAGMSDRRGCFLETRLIVGKNAYLAREGVDYPAWMLELGVR